MDAHSVPSMMTGTGNTRINPQTSLDFRGSTADWKKCGHKEIVKVKCRIRKYGRQKCMGYPLKQDKVGTSKVCIHDSTGQVAGTFLPQLHLAVITQHYHCPFASWCSWRESEPLRIGMLSDIALGPPGPSIHPFQRGIPWEQTPRTYTLPWAALGPDAL